MPFGLTIRRQSNRSIISLATDIRVVVTMACTQCKARNYATTKNRRKTTDRLELRKHCPVCRVHTVHREAK